MCSWRNLENPPTQKGWMLSLWLLDHKVLLCRYISIFQQRIIHQTEDVDRNVVHLFGNIQVHGAVSHGMTLSELQRKINLLIEWKFCFPLSRLLWLLLSTKQKGRELGNASVWLPSGLPIPYPTAKGRLSISTQVHIQKRVCVLCVFLPLVLRAIAHKE